MPSSGLCRDRHSRHTFATDLLRRGLSLLSLMHLLGHKSPRMTLCYLQLTDTDIRQQFFAARLSSPHHLPPLPAASVSLSAETLSVPAALRAALRLLDACRQRLGFPKPLDAFRRRLLKLILSADRTCPE